MHDAAIMLCFAVEQELNRTCRQMQQRIMELLGEVANEEVTSECPLRFPLGMENLCL